MSRWTMTLALALMFALSSGGCRSTPASIDPDDGTLFAYALAASATVLKDGEIAGAGAFVRDDGLFLTAAHVVLRPADRIELLLPGGRVVRAQTIATDLGHDLALLRADGVTPANTLPIAQSPAPAGAPIYMIAAPSMYTETLLHGRIGGGGLGFNFLGNHDSYVRSRLIMADAVPGASGGCWVDTQGRIVGVQSAFIGDDKGSTGIAFIGPGSAAQTLLDQRQHNPATTLGGELVGLRTQSYGFNKRFPPGTTGVAIHRRFEDGPLDRAGIPIDHLITHLDGKPVADTAALYDHVRQRTPGDTVTLTVMAPDSHSIQRYAVQLDALAW